MQGTVVNALSIITGALIGRLLGKRLPEKTKNTVMHAMGLGILLIGIQMALRTSNVLIVVLSIVAGGIVGETLDLEKWLQLAGEWVENRMSKPTGQSRVAEGFITATLIYCVGAMAIIGSLESGLTGNHNILYVKSVLDGVTSALLGTTLGIGVAFSAIPVFLYQGAITLLAVWIQQLLNQPMVAELTATGGIIILAIGLNFLEVKKIRSGNLLPAVAFAVFFTYWAVRLGFYS